jgi:hypothetical protein
MHDEVYTSGGLQETLTRAYVPEQEPDSAVVGKASLKFGLLQFVPTKDAHGLRLVTLEHCLYELGSEGASASSDQDRLPGKAVVVAVLAHGELLFSARCAAQEYATGLGAALNLLAGPVHRSNSPAAPNTLSYHTN